MGNMDRKITPRQQRAILALIECPTVQGAAASAGIGSATLYRWMGDENFRMAFRTARMEVVQQAMANLQKASGSAVGTLLKIMADADVSANVRLSAAKAAIEMVHKSLETEGLSERVSAVEKLISANLGASWRR